MTLRSIICCLLIFTSLFLSAQQFQTETLTVDGNLREYMVYVPASYSGDTPRPLLFNFHGGAGDIVSQIAISDMRSMAESDEVLVVYPQAIGDPNSGNATSWTHKQPTEHDDTEFIAAMIDALSVQYLIDANRIYACGYSNGGEFALELACRMSDRIAAVGSVARSMFIDTYEACAPESPVGVITIHGTNDDYEGIIWAGTKFYVSLDELNEYWSTFNNTDVDPVITAIPNTNTNDGSTVEQFTWSNGDGCASVEHFKVNEGGHDWPGSFGNMDIDTDVELWRFLSQFDLSGQIACNTSSVKEDALTYSVTPNPTTDYIRVDMGETSVAPYQLISAKGLPVMSGTLKSKEALDLTNLSAGLYLLKIGNTITKVVVLD